MEKINKKEAINNIFTALQIIHEFSSIEPAEISISDIFRICNAPFYTNMQKPCEMWFLFKKVPGNKILWTGQPPSHKIAEAILATGRKLISDKKRSKKQMIKQASPERQFEAAFYGNCGVNINNEGSNGRSFIQSTITTRVNTERLNTLKLAVKASMKLDMPTQHYQHWLDEIEELTGILAS